MMEINGKKRRCIEIKEKKGAKDIFFGVIEIKRKRVLFCFLFLCA